MITEQDIEHWCVERFDEVREEGGLAALVLIHYSASGAEAEVHTASAKLPADKWTAPAVAAVMDSVASRHAKGLPGVQQFALAAVYGSSAKPSSTLPFQRVGALSYGTAPGGGLATEGATPTGMAATAQRWGELAIQGASAERLAVLGALAKLVENLAGNNEKLLERNMEFALAVQKLTADQHASKAEAAVRVVNAKRNADLAQTALSLAPSAINAIAGAPIFTESAASHSALTGLARTLNREQLEHLTNLAGGDVNARLAVTALLDQLDAIRSAEAEEERRYQEVTGDLRGNGSYDAGEGDAGGETAPPLAEQSPAPQLVEQTNGHARGARSEGDEILDELFETVPKGKMAMLIGALAGENPTPASVSWRAESRAAGAAPRATSCPAPAGHPVASAACGSPAGRSPHGRQRPPVPRRPRRAPGRSTGARRGRRRDGRWRRERSWQRVDASWMPTSGHGVHVPPVSMYHRGATVSGWLDERN